MTFETSQEFAKRLDAQDPLKQFRDEFRIPVHNKQEQIYFLGNSLGLQPKRTTSFIKEILDQWNIYGVEAFFEGSNPWIDYHDGLQHSLSKIVGSHSHEVVVMNQLTVNLHLMMASFYKPEGVKKKILCEAKAFPSDQYMLETHLKFLGVNPEEVIIEIHPHAGEHNLTTEDIINAIYSRKDELALVLMGGVNYYTGEVLDMQAISKEAHRLGIMVGWDLAHAVGNIKLALHDWDVDFACWCSYKYLNSGPGGVAGVFIHERHHRDQSVNRLGGWWGFDKPKRFHMEKGFRPIQNAEGWQLSTPSLVLLACHKAALEIFDEAGVEQLYAKGEQLSSYTHFLLHDLTRALKLPFAEIITPQAVERRGCQVSMLMLRNGKTVFEEIKKQGVFADWREPNVIRIAPVPLYNRFEEVWKFVNIIRRIENL